jgi:hypothetical protein
VTRPAPNRQRGKRALVGRRHSSLKGSWMASPSIIPPNKHLADWPDYSELFRIVSVGPCPSTVFATIKSLAAANQNLDRLLSPQEEQEPINIFDTKSWCIVGQDGRFATAR